MTWVGDHPRCRAYDPEHHQPRDVVHPAVVGDLAEGVRQAARVGRVGVEIGEPLRHLLPRPQRVVAAVAVALVPVGVPDVVAPADHLPHEPLDARDRRGTTAVRRLRPLDHLERVEQAEVHRRADQAVRHRRVALEDRVLVRAELGQPVLDEVVERRQRLARVAAKRRGPSRPMNSTPSSPTGRGRAAPASSISSSVGHHGSVTPSVRSLRGGSRLSWSKFHCPRGRHRPRQHAVAAPRVAVEVLHQQALPAPAVGPGAKSSRVVANPRGGSTVHAEPPDELEGGVGRRVARPRRRRGDASTTSAYVSVCT